MRSHRTAARLGAWMKERFHAAAREVGQVAAEEASALIKELGLIVIDRAQEGLQRGLTESSEQLREFLQGRKRGN